MTSHLLGLVVLSAAILLPHLAQGVSIEDAAAEVARQSNLKPAAMVDDEIVGFRARSEGKSVIFEYVVAPPASVAQFRRNVEQAVVRLACLENEENEAFRRGLFYTFVYRTKDGGEIATFSVKSATCEATLPWTRHDDREEGFSVRYPASWKVAPKGSANTRFSVASATGSGVCTVLRIADPASAGLSQADVNHHTEELPQDAASWEMYLGSSVSLRALLESRRRSIAGIQALFGVAEVQMQGPRGALRSRMMSALAGSPGRLWVLTCGSFHSDMGQARLEFDEHRASFETFFGTFSLSR